MDEFSCLTEPHFGKALEWQMQLLGLFMNFLYYKYLSPSYLFDVAM